MKTNVKLNLGLNVLRKRPDGFHDLETLFVPCDAFSDELEIRLADGPEKVKAHIEPCSWDPDKDLTVKAYRLLDEEFGLPPVEIFLRKGAPVGAGLGGGSADAAFALRMLNEEFALGLDESALARRAAVLGSDCPFFVYNRPMFAEGRGEILTAFDIDLSGYEIKVEIPAGEAVSTAEAYRGVLAGKSPWQLPLREVLSRPVEQWKDLLHNDFENSVFPAHPAIAALKQRFYEEGAVYSAMSGSGSAVFALFRK